MRFGSGLEPPEVHRFARSANGGVRAGGRKLMVLFGPSCMVHSLVVVNRCSVRRHRKRTERVTDPCENEFLGSRFNPTEESSAISGAGWLSHPGTTCPLHATYERATLCM